MFSVRQLQRAFIIAIWLVVLTFPLMVIKVNTIEDTVQWRWLNALYVGVGSFLLSTVWMYMMERRNRADRRRPIPEASTERTVGERIRSVFQTQRNRNFATGILLAVALIHPFVTSMYQTNIMTSALMFVVLALGLNIIIGLGGMLMLGYIAFYAVGAYSYALLNLHFGLNFWLALPVGAALGGLAGVLVAMPTLHLRGDYLAIVTLGFGEIVRIVLENWNDFSQGPSGIANIPRPGFFGVEMGLSVATIYIYFIVLALVLFTILVVYRLEHSRIGRQWEAMKEDAVASEAMGVNVARSKLSAIALGAVWAGMMGVMFAARTTFINPASFTVWESIIVLSAVVLGGMGSIPGAILGALVIILVPEYLRAFADYRLMLFGAVLVTMMVFRPGGIIQKRRKAYQFQTEEESGPPPPTGEAAAGEAAPRTGGAS